MVVDNKNESDQPTAPLFQESSAMSKFFYIFY